uniref:Uncharacterized protein n=1 Tax=Chlorocebus sabaeus TaxID=60711 RepID=A0A0D9S066_CHLSB
QMRKLRPGAPRGLGGEAEVEVVEGCSPAGRQSETPPQKKKKKGGRMWSRDPGSDGEH